MSTIPGVVTNGVVVPHSPLPEGAHLEIQLSPDVAKPLLPATGAKPGQLRRLARADRQAILAAAAERAEQDYRNNKELTGFDAFEDEQHDDEHDANP